MRIIGGRYRSRQLKTLRGAHTRPTSDRLRETLFNVLGASVAGAVFADAYAGSGAVGLEALSRGAEWVYFLESHRPAVKVIRENLAQLQVETGAEVLPFDALGSLRELEQRGVRLDIVFLDPPYQTAEEYQRALAWLGGAQLLAPDAWVIAEHSRRRALEEGYGALARPRVLRQGDAALSFFRRAG